MSPQLLAIALAVGLSYYAVVEVRTGAHYLWHKSKHAVHKLVHPHDTTEQTDGQK